MDIGRRAVTFILGRRYYALLVNEDGLVTDNVSGMSPAEAMQFGFDRPSPHYDPHMGGWWASARLDRDRLDRWIDDCGYRRCDRRSDPVATVMTLLAHVSPDRRVPLLRAVAKACHPDGDGEMRPASADTLAVAIGDLLAFIRSGHPEALWTALAFEPGDSSNRPVTTERPVTVTTSPARTCARCGVAFAAVRLDARYCSGRCRVAAHRDRRGG